MPTELHRVFGAWAPAAITLAGLAAGAGRISDRIDFRDGQGGEYDFLQVEWKLRTGAVAPAAGAPYFLYLVRAETAGAGYSDEGLGAVDAAVPTQPNRTENVDTIPARNAIGADLYASIEVPNPGAFGSFLVWNGTAQALDATPANLYVRYRLGSMRMVTVP